MRQTSVPQAPPSHPRLPQVGPPLPPTNNPPPSSTFTNTSDIDLDIDINGVLAKINVSVPIIKIIKIASMRIKVEKFFRVQGEPLDPRIMLQANHLRTRAPTFIQFLANEQ
jgi:hypothetical protein